MRALLGRVFNDARLLGTRSNMRALLGGRF
jgi:hypothetical protein